MGDESSFLCELKVALRKIKNEPGANPDLSEICTDKPVTLDNSGEDLKVIRKTEKKNEPTRGRLEHSGRKEDISQDNGGIVQSSSLAVKDFGQQHQQQGGRETISRDYVEVQKLLKAKMGLAETNLDEQKTGTIKKDNCSEIQSNLVKVSGQQQKTSLNRDYVDLQKLLKARIKLVEANSGAEQTGTKSEDTKLNNQCGKVYKNREASRTIEMLNNDIKMTGQQETKICNVKCSQGNGCKVNHHNGINTFVTSTPVTSETNSPHTSHDISIEDGEAAASNALLKSNNNDRRDSSPKSKVLHDILYEELHFVLKKRTEVRPKVNMDRIGKSKCGKSIVFYGRSSRRKNSDSSSMNSSMGSTNDSGSPQAVHSPRLGIVRENSNHAPSLDDLGEGETLTGSSVPNINASVREGKVSLLRDKFDKIDTLFDSRNQPSAGQQSALKSPVSSKPPIFETHCCTEPMKKKNNNKNMDSSLLDSNKGNMDDLNRFKITSIVKNTKKTTASAEPYSICDLNDYINQKEGNIAVRFLGETSECSPDSTQSQIDYEPVEKLVQSSNLDYDAVEKVSEIRKVFEEKVPVNKLDKKLSDGRPRELEDSSMCETSVYDELQTKMAVLPDAIFKPTCLRIVCKPLDECDRLSAGAPKLEPQCKNTGTGETAKIIASAGVETAEDIEVIGASNEKHEKYACNKKDSIDRVDRLLPAKNVKMNALVNEITECIERKGVRQKCDIGNILRRKGCSEGMEERKGLTEEDKEDGAAVEGSNTVEKGLLASSVPSDTRIPSTNGSHCCSGTSKTSKQYVIPKSMSSANCKEGSCLCDISDISPIPKTKSEGNLTCPDMLPLPPPPPPLPHHLPPPAAVPKIRDHTAVEYNSPHYGNHHRRDHSLPCKSKHSSSTHRRDYSLPPPVPSRGLVASDQELTVHIPVEYDHNSLTSTIPSVPSIPSSIRPSHRSDTSLSSSPDIRILKKRDKPLPPIPVSGGGANSKESVDSAGQIDVNEPHEFQRAIERNDTTSQRESANAGSSDFRGGVAVRPMFGKKQKSQKGVDSAVDDCGSVVNVVVPDRSYKGSNSICPSSVAVSSPQPLSYHGHDQGVGLEEILNSGDDDDISFDSIKHPGSLVSHLVESVRESVGDLKNGASDSCGNAAIETDLEVMMSDQTSINSCSTDCSGLVSSGRKSSSSVKLARGKRVYKKRYVSLKDPTESIAVTMQNVKALQSDVSLTTVTSCDNSTSTTDDCCASIGHKMSCVKPVRGQSPRPQDVIGDSNRKSPTEGRKLLYMFGPRDVMSCMLDDKKMDYIQSDFSHKGYDTYHEHTTSGEDVGQQYHCVQNPQSSHHNASTTTDLQSESAYHTFPMQRSFRRTERAPQDKEIIAALMITHTGDRIPPDGAECDLANNPLMNQQRIVTVPQPTSFHQHGGNNTTNNTKSLVDGMYGDDVNLRGNRISPARHHPAKNPCRRYKAHYEGNSHYNHHHQYDDSGDSASNASPVRHRRYLRHQSSFEREHQKYLLYHTWSSNAARKIKHSRGSGATNTGGHGHHNSNNKQKKMAYDNPVLLDGCDANTCTSTLNHSGWDGGMVHADPRLDKVKRAKYRTANNYGSCHQQDGSTSSSAGGGAPTNCVPVLDTGFLGCSPRQQQVVLLPRTLSDSVSVQSVCTYVWDCTDHHMTTVHVPTNDNNDHNNDSSFSTDFGDEFCDAYERSLLDYVRTKDITDIDNEILSIHQQQVKAGRRCMALRRGGDGGGGLMRRLAKCFICHSHVSSISSHSISRASSYSDHTSCPITQNIIDTATGIVVSGEGLYKATQNRPAEFRVNAKGHRGDLFVQVEGPNSIARCQVEPDGAGTYIVRYTPVEAGRFSVTLKWNNTELSGSPYHPEVINPSGVHIIGGWASMLDANNQMALQVNSTKRVEFDTSLAGPGHLTCEVQGPNGKIPTFVDNQGGHCAVTFTPTVEGDHYISICWSGIHIQNSPFHGFAANLRQVNSEKVVLSGRGLKEAKVKEESEFVIDGSQAGPGEPSVQLTGIKTDISVQCLPIGDNKYRCSYVPKLAGAYLLSIMWSGRHVKGGPYKVNVMATSDASKVVATGEGLKMGIMGRDIKATIDVRRAGPGELTAHCMGPTKASICELFDHHDGTFTLSVKPSEPGRHVLQIMFGGEHVPGSPFELKISGAPDASKVRVSGPGIEHGILATYQSKFLCETKGAGAGQLTVRIRGPKGAFRVEMQRESQKDRTILCQYEPREVGDYIVSVKWSAEHVPGSPFRVQIFDTQQELERFLREHPERRTNAPRMTNGWHEDF